MGDLKLETKPWYKSYLVWLGILITIQGALPVIMELANKQAITTSDILVAVSGIVVVIRRVWFTTASIEGSNSVVG